mmetsp:Transcript_13501/g.20553  ORF Transcript_13501/g.20553 Transcript_13501/m.20553 type:complete len:192 (-) Transcript_13501:223-798(-)|eukprot:CAMPEP_0196811806 /NCGR_PEP_ID=MMETSP1362-20130617/20067_1 /TAXON_ID=163516 /ORGANISM="Leptocylindrus danicus, Strain CCMP1856" /LENGTH=191 /DNA_ID=CAMNT_0042187189 /DNA_START=45 /DNA_END=620 /DNA_ORIENTATION=+
MNYNGNNFSEDPLWYKEKAKYKNTACRPNGRIGPVCVCKRIVRGYKASKSFKEENDHIMQLVKTPCESYSKNTGPTKKVYRKMRQMKEQRKKDAALAVGVNVSGALIADAAIPVAAGAFTLVGLGISAGIGVFTAAVHCGVRSVIKAYDRGRQLDRAMLREKLGNGSNSSGLHARNSSTNTAQCHEIARFK